MAQLNYSGIHGHRKISIITQANKLANLCWPSWLTVLAENTFFSIEKTSDTRDSVSSCIQTPRIPSKIFRCVSYFQLSSRCLDIPMKHCLSCLVHYFTIMQAQLGPRRTTSRHDWTSVSVEHCLFLQRTENVHYDGNSSSHTPPGAMSSQPPQAWPLFTQ